MPKRVSHILGAIALLLCSVTTLNAADIDAGKKVFKKCKACHTLDKGGKNKVGPNLWGIIERDVATHDGFKYSKAMKDYSGSWSADRLDLFLKKPKAEIKGTKMAFGGLKKEKDRINLIAYLNSMSDQPIVLGATTITEPDTSDTDTSEAEYGELKIAKGVDVTYDNCTECHSEQIVAHQGQTRQGWEDLLAWMVEKQGAPQIEEPDHTIILDYLATNYGIGHGEKHTIPSPDSEFGVLYAAPGVEETYSYCTACHSERTVAQQGLTKESWEELLEWMIDEQDMDVIDEPEYTAIINYLTINYGVDRPNFPN